MRMRRFFFWLWIGVILWRGFYSVLVFGAQDKKVDFLFEIKDIKENYSFCRPQGLFVDERQQKIYVADTDNHKVAIFSLIGEHIGFFEPSHSISSPIGMAVDKEGNVFLSQREKNSIEVFSSKGVFLYALPRDDFARKEEFSPGRIALNSLGRIYAVNRKKSEVWVFEKEGDFAFSFSGSGEGKFRFITDLILCDEKIYITDAQGVPVQVFNQEGKFLYSLGKHSQNKEDFSFPRAIAVDRHRRLWVVDAFRHQVYVYSHEGKLLFQVGSYGREKGNFCFPVDLDIDHEDRLYILEKGDNRFQVFQVKEGD